MACDLEARDRVVDIERALLGTPEQAGLIEKVEAILRFLGGTVVVRPKCREVVVEKVPQ